MEKIISLKNKFLKLSFKKKVLFCIGILMALILGWRIIGIITKKPDYTTARITKSTITEEVSETGKIEVSGRIDVYSPTNGVVEDVFVSNGQEVEEGDVLFKVKSSASEQEKSDALEALLLAQSNLGSANATMFSLESAKDTAWKKYYDIATNSTYQNSDGSPNTSSRALPEFTTSRNNWLAAEAQFKNQQAVVNQARSAVNSAYLAYQATQNTTVKSPIKGTVSNLSVAPNKSVRANTPTQSAHPVLALASFTNPEVVIQLGESDITKIREGQQAKIVVSAANKKTYRGRVIRVDSLGTDNAGVIKYNTYIQFTNPDTNLRSGMDADISISTQTVSNVLSVPNSAVKPYKGGRAVRIPGKKNGEVIYKPVQIGVRGSSKTQILSGLKEGEIVIISLSNEQLKRPGLFGG